MRDIGITGYVIIVLLLVISVIIFIASKVHIILSVDVDNNDFIINVNIKYLFNLINIKKQLYPPKNKKSKGKEKQKNKIKKQKINTKLALSDFLSFWRAIKKIEMYEVYSKINYGSEIFSFTSFIYILINSIYGYVANIVNSEKIYLVVNPDYTKNYVKASIRFHAIPSIKNLIVIGIAVIKISHKNKEADIHESDKFNTKSYGNNC